VSYIPDFKIKIKQNEPSNSWRVWTIVILETLNELVHLEFLTDAKITANS